MGHENNGYCQPLYGSAVTSVFAVVKQRQQKCDAVLECSLSHSLSCTQVLLYALNFTKMLTSRASLNFQYSTLFHALQT